MSKQSDTALVDGVIRAAAHLEPELEEALAEHGLTRPSFLVLLALRAADGEQLSQRDLMASVRRTSGTLSVRLARLERAGYVTRERDPDDRRGAIVTLADRGRERVDAAQPAYQETASRLAAGLPERHGVLVVRVKRGGAADAAGLSRGDLVVGAAGDVVHTVGDLERALRHADGALRLDVVRGVEERAVDVKLGPAS